MNCNKKVVIPEQQYHKALKEVSIEFAKFLDEQCIRSVFGWVLHDGLTEWDNTEFQLDELFDFWKNKVLQSAVEP